MFWLSRTHYMYNVQYLILGWIMYIKVWSTIYVLAEVLKIFLKYFTILGH